MVSPDSRKGLSNRAVLFLSVVFLGATVGFAQLPTATILGVVRDRTGAVVPEGALTARNVNTGQSRTTVSAPDGSYRFSALPVGSYEIQIEHPGFQSETRSGLTLVVGQEAVVNFVLQVGAVEQRVEVTADAPLVNTTSGSLGGLVDERKVADLPLNGRNFIDLTLLQPGVQTHKNWNTTSTIRGAVISSGGAPWRSNSYLLDGANMVNAFGTGSASITGTTLGVEGIREFRVVTNSFSAEYGMVMGSQMMIVTKSGTNSFHGSLFEYLRNSVLDARNFFDYKDDEEDRRLPAFSRNNFGGSLGGPIQKDKLFFHTVYEGVREALGLSIVNDTIPVSDRVDGRLVPQIAPVVKPLLALYPLPNLPNDQFTYPFTQRATENYGQSRVDYTASSKDTLFVRYTIDDGQFVGPREFPQFTENGVNRSQFLTLSENRVFSPALLNLFRFSYSRTLLNSTGVTDVIGPQVSLVAGQPTGTINIGGVTRLGSSGSISVNKQNLFTWSNDLFYTRGAHSLKFGALINRYQQYFLGARQLNGSMTFADIRSFLLAQPSNYVAVTPGSAVDRTYHFTTLGFYIQDDWRVRRGLTLNLGLRYEFNTQIQETQGRGAALRDIQHDADTTLGPPMVNPSLRNVGPRVGFAWDVTGDSRTAVRGGFGLVYDVGNMGHALQQGTARTPPFSGESSVARPPTFTLPLTFPAGAAARGLGAPDYRMQQPHLLQYNLTVERQLPLEMAMSLTYAGSRGMNILQLKEGNPTVPQILPDGRQFWAGNESRTNPAWGTIGLVTAGGNSWYNSLQFGLSKRLSRGLQFQSSYTWSKLMDETQGITVGDNNLSSQPFGSDPTHREVDRGLSSFDLSHSWRFNAIYRLPELVPSGGAAGKLLNGWWMSGILKAESGYPFSPVLSANRSRSQVNAGGNQPDRPDLVPGRSLKDVVLGGPERYFDPSVFKVPPIGFLGNAGRNIIRGPGDATLDFSLAKDTALGFLGEAGKLEFRAEFFNLLNRVNFGQVNRIVFAARNDVEAPLANAGRITATSGTSRQIQLALKLIF